MHLFFFHRQHVCISLFFMDNTYASHFSLKWQMTFSSRLIITFHQPRAVLLDVACDLVAGHLPRHGCDHVNAERIVLHVPHHTGKPYLLSPQLSQLSPNPLCCAVVCSAVSLPTPPISRCYPARCHPLYSLTLAVRAFLSPSRSSPCLSRAVARGGGVDATPAIACPDSGDGARRATWCCNARRVVLQGHRRCHKPTMPRCRPDTLHRARC